MSTAVMWALIDGLFWLGFLVVVLAIILAFRSHKTLQTLKKSLAQGLGNLQDVVNQRATEVNQMYRLLTEQTSWQGSGTTELSRNTSPDSILTVYGESGALLLSMEEIVALRFPDLNVHSEFIQVGRSIEQSEKEIKKKAQLYNSSVRIYNGARSSIPTIFFANLLGYPPADRIDLASITVENDDDLEENNLEEFANLGTATKTLSTAYFYMFPGGVPKGPASAHDLKRLLAQGVLQNGAMVAEVGSQEWKSIEAVSAEWEEAAN